MDSPQSIVSPFKSSSVGESEKMKPEEASKSETALAVTSGSSIGVLDVFLHHAREIQNICIYHKQDVYAKLSLTSDPEETASSKIINGGGQNPVFNDTIRLNVKTLDCYLKCEIYMMSRVRNYLEDQLLGLALVPLSEVLLKNGKLEKEFSLSSSDLFHSPAGFVHLSLSYEGPSPEVLAIPSGYSTQGSEISDDLSKIEFPDPKIVSETRMMVSNYLGIDCNNLAADCDPDNHVMSELGVRLVESFSAPKADSSLSSISSPSESSEAVGKSSDAESDASVGKTINDVGAKPVITLNKVPESSVVQQEIVDMYMKSMQQFTESLAKMKLPLDIDSGPASSGSGSSTSDPNIHDSKNASSKVFYGSRAFF